MDWKHFVIVVGGVGAMILSGIAGVFVSQWWLQPPSAEEQSLNGCRAFLAEDGRYPQTQSHWVDEWGRVHYRSRTPLFGGIPYGAMVAELYDRYFQHAEPEYQLPAAMYVVGDGDQDWIYVLGRRCQDLVETKRLADADEIWEEE